MVHLFLHASETANWLRAASTHLVTYTTNKSEPAQP